MNPLMKTTELERSVRQCMFQETPLDIFAESHSMDLHDVITLLEDFWKKVIQLILTTLLKIILTKKVSMKYTIIF